MKCGASAPVLKEWAQMADAMPKHRNHRPFQIAITVRLCTIASRGFFLLLLGFLHVFYISATFARARLQWEHRLWELLWANFSFFSAALLMRLLLPLSSGNVLYLWDGDFFRYIRGFVRGERRTESIEPPQSALFAHNKCYIVFVNVRKLSVRQPEGCYYVAGLNLWCVADDNFAIKNAAIIELGGGGRWGKARRWGLCGADFIRFWRQQRLKCATSYCCLCLFSHCDLGQYAGLSQRGS